jgi:GABA permease
MKRLFSGTSGIFLITLFLIWSVVGLAVAAMVIWTDPPTLAWIGLVVPVLVAMLLSVSGWVLLRHERPSSGLPTGERAPIAPDAHRILVVANETLRGAALHDGVRRRAAERPTEVLIVAPSLASAVAHWTNDEDAARDAAAERIDETCTALADLGVDARGEVGDDDPLRAVEDSLRTFGADEIVVSTHPQGRSSWLEADAVERLRAFYEIPVVHVIVDEGQEHVVTRSAA